MNSPFSAALFAILFAALIAPFAAAQEEPPVAPQAPVPEAPVPQPPGSEGPVIEPDEELWTLGDQQWDFSEVGAIYLPVKGTLDPAAGTATWTLEIARDLSRGEATMHSAVPGSPFRLVLLDDEKTAVVGDLQATITPITGKAGDRARVTVKLPKAQVLERVKLVRVERRTNVGF